MAVTAITDEFTMDISITRARYAELIKAEHDAECLKALICCKFKDYGSISYDELKMLYAMYFGEVGKDDTDT